MEQKIICILCEKEEGRTGTNLCDECWELKNRIESDIDLTIKVLNGMGYPVLKEGVKKE